MDHSIVRKRNSTAKVPSADVIVPNSNGCVTIFSNFSVLHGSPFSIFRLASHANRVRPEAPTRGAICQVFSVVGRAAFNTASVRLSQPRIIVTLSQPSVFTDTHFRSSETIVSDFSRVSVTCCRGDSCWLAAQLCQP